MDVDIDKLAQDVVEYPDFYGQSSVYLARAVLARGKVVEAARRINDCFVNDPLLVDLEKLVQDLGKALAELEGDHV